MIAIEGADFSSCQTTKIDWPAYKAAGKDFAIMKAAEGSAGVDPSSEIDTAGAIAAGVLVGKYIFAHPTSLDALAEVENLWKHLGANMPAMGIFLDVETPLKIAGHEREVVKFIEDFVTCWATKSAMEPTLYSYLSYLQQIAPYVGPDSVIRTLKIWLAWYGNGLPKMPACYGEIVMVQYSGDNGAPVPGVPVVVDHNRFLGDMDALRKFCGFPDTAPATLPTFSLPDIDNT